MIAIIDYGTGNIHSVQKALESLGAKIIVASDFQGIKEPERIVLPGVGTFKQAFFELKQRGLIEAIRKHIEKKRPFLGICLGMQLLFERSQEADEVKGLGWLKGGVEKFLAQKNNIKVPHMGWNQLKIKKEACPLLKDIPDDSYVYFCHSYYPKAQDLDTIAATTNYGVDFTSLVWQDNMFGVQFHPEKSQKVGIKILENFIKF